MNHITLIVIVAVVLLLGVGVWYFMNSAPQPAPVVVTPPPAASPQATQVITTSTSLGAQIYGQTQDPLGGKLQDVNPVQTTNPIKGLYKNPFE